MTYNWLSLLLTLHEMQYWIRSLVRNPLLTYFMYFLPPCIPLYLWAPPSPSPYDVTLGRIMVIFKNLLHFLDPPSRTEFRGPLPPFRLGRSRERKKEMWDREGRKTNAEFQNYWQISDLLTAIYKLNENSCMDLWKSFQKPVTSISSDLPTLYLLSATVQLFDLIKIIYSEKVIKL